MWAEVGFFDQQVLGKRGETGKTTRGATTCGAVRPELANSNDSGGRLVVVVGGRRIGPAQKSFDVWVPT